MAVLVLGLTAPSAAPASAKGEIAGKRAVAVKVKKKSRLQAPKLGSERIVGGRQAGITSWGEACAEPGKPGVLHAHRRTGAGRLGQRQSPGAVG